MTTLGLLITTCGLSNQAFSQAPVYHYRALVAGQGDAGYRDGKFWQALFNCPRSFALSSDSSKLLVTDSGNNRVRVIDLLRDHEVSTLAGDGVAGSKDGDGLKASFANPSLIEPIDRDRYIVYDRGSSRFRELAANGQVTTLTWINRPEEVSAPGWNDVWNILFIPGRRALLVSQPSRGLVRILWLASRKISVLAETKGQLSEPATLGFLPHSVDHVLVGDRATGKLWRVRLPMSDAEPPSADLEELGTLSNALGSALSQGELYFLTPGAQFLQRGLPPQPVRQFIAWGAEITPSDPEQPRTLPFVGLPVHQPAQVRARPSDPTQLLISDCARNRIISYRDLRFDTRLQSVETNAGLSDFEYPKQKPPGVTRILLAGDSRTFQEGSGFQRVAPFTRFNNFAKQFELHLAIASALEARRDKFEVLQVARISSAPLFAWPVHRLPPLAEEYSVDLSLLVVAAPFSLQQIFEFPHDEHGIFDGTVDPEYALKSAASKLDDPVLKKVYDVFQRAGRAVTDSSGNIGFAQSRAALESADIRRELVELFGRHLGALKDRLGKIRNAPRLALVLAPIMDGPAQDIEGWSILMTEVAQSKEIPVLDLTPDIVTVRETLYGIVDGEGYIHPTRWGHEMLGLLLSRKLLGRPDLLSGK